MSSTLHVQIDAMDARETSTHVEHKKTGHVDNPTISAKPSKNRLFPEPDKTKKRIQGPMKPLALGAASQSGNSLGNTFVVREESPWDTFRKVYECELAGHLEVVMHRVRPSRLFTVKTFKGKDTENIRYLFERLQHPNIFASQEGYFYHNSLYILHSDISVSLDHIVACDAYLDEIELAAILAQILDGLLYLSSQQVKHQNLSTSNILVTGSGEVKIAGLEGCVELHERCGRYTEELQAITMEMMQKYVKEDNKTGIDDVERWPCDSSATQFLSSVASGLSIKELREHVLFTKNTWRKGHLIGLVSFASRTSFTYCSYSTKERAKV